VSSLCSNFHICFGTYPEICSGALQHSLGKGGQRLKLHIKVDIVFRLSMQETCPVITAHHGADLVIWKEALVNVVVVTVPSMYLAF
jgi:hypothetical protein